MVFVRHAIPGETVRAQITEAGSKGFWRADAIEVLSASPDRVASPWPAAGPGGVGGAELAHLRGPAQRRWKASVLNEQLRRLAGLDIAAPVVAASGDDDRAAMGWRTRASFVVGRDGRAGMRRFRSHDVVALDSMPLATEGLQALLEQEEVFSRKWKPGTLIDAVAPADGSPGLILVNGVPWHHGRADHRAGTRKTVQETFQVRGRTLTYRVTAAGFWQVHRMAPQILVAHVLNLLEQGLTAEGLRGARVADLYSGAGLFTVPLAAAVGPAGSVASIEAGAQAVRDARRNLKNYDTVQFHEGKVESVLPGLGGPFDAIVLDPPRTGAGRSVVEAIAAVAPQVIVYVACDPAALARDIALLADHGYSAESVTGFDLFPATHHLESVALLTRA
ncbi:TRAM domain-containing protein [Rarobacter incanus]